MCAHAECAFATIPRIQNEVIWEMIEDFDSDLVRSLMKSADLPREEVGEDLIAREYQSSEIVG